MNKGVVVITVLAMFGTGAFLYIKNKNKKKIKQADKQNSTPVTTTTTSNGVLYTGLTSQQTKALQNKLNEFIQQGGLGYVMGILGDLGTTEFRFVRNSDKSVQYQHKIAGGQNWSSWCSYVDWMPNDGGSKAFVAWVKDGESPEKIYNNKGELVSGNTSTTNKVSEKDSEAIAEFRKAIEPSLTSGKLVVDGAYGEKTMAVVTALQVYLNAKHGANLIVDGKYGNKTDLATGWGICV